jgi:nuclear pore complex protein Nup205
VRPIFCVVKLHSYLAGGALGYDLLTARYDSLKYERRTLATVLFLIARMGYVQPPELLLLVEWLEKNSHHAMTYYILPSILACFDIVDPLSPGGQARQKLARDSGLLSSMKRKLSSSVDWKEPGLKATILLKWTLFLTEIRHRDHSLEDKEGFKTEELETQVWNAVQGDCFSYLTRMVSLLQRKQGDSPQTSFAGSVLSRPEPEAMSEVPADDFKPVVLESFESLIRSLITHASSELRKIKQRQEDLLLANARTDRNRMLRSTLGQSRHPSHPPASESSSQTAPPRNDIAMLYSLLGLLYSALPAERALQFWGGGQGEGQRMAYLNHVESTTGKLPSFLQWAVWSTQIRDVDMLMALYDMLAGLSKGQHCSELAYNFLVRGASDFASSSSLQSTTSSGPAVSWTAIFGLLEQWSTAGATARPVQPTGPIGSQMQVVQTHRYPQLVLSQQDVLLAQAFLRLLSTVVTWSVDVRITISGHARFKAVPTLVSLIPLSIPLELKGALLDTLSSFCLPGGGTPGVEVCRSVWTLMERLEVINVRVPPGTTGATLSSVKGIEMELEEIESVHKLYPETIPFLKLLSTLIHTPKSIPAGDRLVESEPLNTIPESLGQPYRSPGIEPYVAFVVDNVFTRISQREYLQPTDRWKMNDLCLCFVERCLASFDLQSLVSGSDDLSTKGELLLQLAVHPGHEIMKRMLTRSGLHNSIFSYIVDGLDGFDNGLAEEEPFFRHTITRVLRIIHQVLEIQDIFLDVFIPLLGSVEDSTLVGPVHPVSYYIRLDQALMFTPEHVPAIAAYVSYPAYLELGLLAVKILTALSTPTTVSQLAVIIDRSSDSIRILDGFRSILDTASSVDVEEAEAAVDEKIGAGAPELSNLEEVSDTLTQALRLAVLEFFIQNTTSDRSYPNVAHLLLFGKASADDQIQDPNALGSRRVSIHSLLDIVNYGIPRLKSKGKGSRVGRVANSALLATLPAFAERCYLILYQLCKHPRTSDFTMRYLRSREDFFARHLAALPFRVPARQQEPYIEIQYNDGSRVITTVPAFCAFLRVRSIIFDLVALELHILTNKGHHKSAMELLELLYGNEEDLVSAEPAAWEEEIFKPFHEVGQSHIPVIEFLQSLDFDWSDSLAVQPIDLEFFGHLNLSSCIQVDASGCEVVDRTSLVSLLTTARRSLHIQGRVLTQTHLQQAAAEIAYILESCAIENHRRKVLHSTAGCYESWRRLLDMTLTKCFHRIPQDRREGLLFDLLHVLPTVLRSCNTPDATAGVLAEAILSALTKLREDKFLQSLIQPGSNPDSGALPAERLFALLRSLLECIVDSNRSELVRGNLYASVINYVHLIVDARPGEGTIIPASLSKIQGGWTAPDELAGSTSRPSDTWQCAELTPSLVTGSLSILKPTMDNLVSLVSRDAIDGTDVWKTVAFMLLDSLVRLSQFERQPAVVIAMSRTGFTHGFVHGIKETDLQLQAVLKPDPGTPLSLLYCRSSF